MSKKKSSLFGGSELIQLNAEGLEGLFDDEDDSQAVQTEQTDQVAQEETTEA